MATDKHTQTTSSDASYSDNTGFPKLPQDLLSNYFTPESDCLKRLRARAQLGPKLTAEITGDSMALVRVARDANPSTLGVENFLKQYSLDTDEGIAIMCLAEALIRIPDKKTALDFISSQLGSADWKKHLGKSSSFLVNASTWGLNLSGKLFKPNQNDHDSEHDKDYFNYLDSTIQKLGAPIARKAIRQAMTTMGSRFVSGTTIAASLKNNESERKAGYCHSYDMLGEAAITQEDANHFFDSYLEAIQAIGSQAAEIKQRSTLSIKLSALHARYEPLQASAIEQLYYRLHELVTHAVSLDVPITIDAEESFRLESSLRIFARLFEDPVTSDWPKLGLAVQAYQKRAPYVVDWLMQLAQAQNKKIPIRLVKGAYWDSEIKWAQQAGLADYPVYTQKHITDLCYLACAEQLLRNPHHCYPQFATHNIHTITSIQHYAQELDTTEYEFQRLHGMGESIYNHLVQNHPETTVRIYAPVGPHKKLLPYLVRRLLENGANSSFVYHLNDHRFPSESLVRDPFTMQSLKSNAIPTPPHIFGDERENSPGVAIGSELDLQQSLKPVLEFLKKRYDYSFPATENDVERFSITNPANQNDLVGAIPYNTGTEIEAALSEAYDYFPQWNDHAAYQRGEYLIRFGKLLEHNASELHALLMREAGKTFESAIAEVREAIDFCRYYTGESKRLMSEMQTLRGSTGEANELYLEGRGVFLCISPWNFPLAIFVGQICAALAAGNCVIAKPAPQTPLIARRVMSILHQTGIPRPTCHYILCSSDNANKLLTSDPRIAGVAFTGSTATARAINRQLAARDGSIIPFIAETGGQNAMIVDSTVLPEQVALDIISSAFDSAGQRCSALRVVFLQEEIADPVIERLKNRMALLKVGKTNNLETDIGPIISKQSKIELLEHIEFLHQNGTLLAQSPLPEGNEGGHFVAPTLFEIPSADILQGEVFGPILHVVRYQAGAFAEVITQIKNTGFGLTLGIHSRMENKARAIAKDSPVGNVYINRTMIGATVGVQPFGGQRASGTGPKAGGPNYLMAFCTEKHLSINTSAWGGNANLLS